MPSCLLGATPVYAQTQAPGRAFPQASWPLIITGEIGTQQSLGYEPLHLAAGIDLEKPIGRWLELDPGVSWSPDHSAITHDGNSLDFRTKGILWSGQSQTLGLAGGVRFTHLWTGQPSHRESVRA